MTRDWARLGKHLTESRRAAGLTQADLASQLNLSRSTIQKVERGAPFVRSLAIHTAMARAVGWSEESVEQVLAGGDPVLADREAHAPPGQGGGELDTALADLSRRVRMALLGGEVVDGDVIDLAPDDPDSVAVLILKRGAARPDATREEMRADLQKWARLQRAARKIFSDDGSDTEGY